MDFTKSFIKSKNPCMDGFRWYLRHHRDGSDYQKVLDDLVSAGRTQDACWLLDKLGPTNATLQLDHLESGSLVFAGTVDVRGAIVLDGLLHTGGAVLCGGPLHVSGEVRTGGDLKVSGGLNCAHDVLCAGLLTAEWHSQIGGHFSADELKALGNLHCGSMAVARAASVMGDLVVDGDCSAKALSVRHIVQTKGFLRLQQGLVCGGDTECGGHLEAGLGIKAGGHILAGKSIRAGESLEAQGEIRAGMGYGIFAGLCVQKQDWETSARVRAAAMPVDLLSGFWTNERSAPGTPPHPGVASEVRDAH